MAMRIVTLLENTSARPDVCPAHGLSLYLETERHRILFDMGPGEQFLGNARALGVDLAAVDTAILSHGHYDHGGGLDAFCRLNDHAALYIQKEAFGDYFAMDPGKPRYIGLSPAAKALRDRAVLTEGTVRIDEELTLFSDPPMGFDAMAANGLLTERTEAGFRPDVFRHEQNLLIASGGRTLLVAGCAHRGSVNILSEARRQLGRDVDVFLGGFHLFELPRSGESDAFIDATGRALAESKTEFYTGHCTGDYAYERLTHILGRRLHRISGGRVLEL